MIRKNGNRFTMCIYIKQCKAHNGISKMSPSVSDRSFLAGERLAHAVPGEEIVISGNNTLTRKNYLLKKEL